LLILLALPGCWLPSQPIGIEMRNKTRFESEWQAYLDLPGPKALAVAGDLDGVYASGFAAGASNEQEATDQALRDCDDRRADRRIADPCQTYAIGDRITRP
jgi:hypothetical protein